MRASKTTPSTGSFRTTQWTRVLSAKGAATDSGAGEALRDLCADYYAPVVAFLIRDGRRPDAARELAHEFFAFLLAGDPLARIERERGRFRSYLIGALKHFIANQRQHANRERRGGGIAPLALDAEQLNDCSPSLVIADDAALTPDASFDRQWALTVLARALEVLREEFTTEGNASRFEKLKPWLTGESSHGDQAALAAELGMETNALKVAIHRLRQRYRQAIRNEVGRTLEDPQAVEDEMQSLFAALS